MHLLVSWVVTVLTASFVTGTVCIVRNEQRLLPTKSNSNCIQVFSLLWFCCSIVSVQFEYMSPFQLLLTFRHQAGNDCHVATLRPCAAYGALLGIHTVVHAIFLQAIFAKRV